MHFQISIVHTATVLKEMAKEPTSDEAKGKGKKKDDGKGSPRDKKDAKASPRKKNEGNEVSRAIISTCYVIWVMLFGSCYLGHVIGIMLSGTVITDHGARSLWL